MLVLGSAGAIPPNLWHRLVRVIESFQVPWNYAKPRYLRILFRAVKQRLQAYAYSEKWFAGFDVRDDRFGVRGGFELRQTVSKVANAREDQFLRVRLSVSPSFYHVRSYSIESNSTNWREMLNLHRPGLRQRASGSTRRSNQVFRWR